MLISLKYSTGFVVVGVYDIKPAIKPHNSGIRISNIVCFQRRLFKIKFLVRSALTCRQNIYYYNS
jgi:hypothetical protein